MIVRQQQLTRKYDINYHDDDDPPSSILSFRYMMTVVHRPASGPTFLANEIFLESTSAAINPAVEPDRNALTSLNFESIGDSVH